MTPDQTKARSAALENLKSAANSYGYIASNRALAENNADIFRARSGDDLYGFSGPLHEESWQSAQKMFQLTLDRAKSLGISPDEINATIEPGYTAGANRSRQGLQQTIEHITGPDPSSFYKVMKPLLQAAAIIPSPIQPLAQFAVAGEAAMQGNPLPALVALIGMPSIETATNAATNAATQAATNTATNTAANAATQAAIKKALLQGALAEAQGGSFLEGAALSGVGSLAGGFIQPGLSESLGGGSFGNITADALIGGGMSELSGGKFSQGALLSGIGSGINQAKLSAASDYLDSLPGGYGEYSDLPPDMSDFDLPPAIIDTSFTPDYSLSTGRPVIPDMGAQGIQVPTINEVVDVVNQPVDYSLPIPNSGLGFQMPTAPNLDSMGGGQGITVPVSGGTLAETGVIPNTFVPDLGDPNSFINQPVPNVSVNIPELPATTPKNIDTELALLNAAKNLAPVVVGSLLADKVLGQADQKTGFDIVPIPTDWRSPEYNQTFTPSEAIDFGNAGMLAGTQFARQPQAATPSFYNLSDVINTLNFQSVPFAQQQLQMPQQSFSVPDILQQFQTPSSMGMNDFIGEIDGTPMSLNSIIAGIQSQYG